MPAKLHLLELPFYAAALAILLPRMGLAGALCITWSFRLFLDACFLFAAASWLEMLPVRSIVDLLRLEKPACFSADSEPRCYCRSLLVEVCPSSLK